MFVCLVWFFASQSTIFQLCGDGSSWVEPVLSKDKYVLLKDTTQCRRWGSNPRPLGIESSILGHSPPIAGQYLGEPCHRKSAIVGTLFYASCKYIRPSVHSSVRPPTRPPACLLAYLSFYLLLYADYFAGECYLFFEKKGNLVPSCLQRSSSADDMHWERWIILINCYAMLRIAGR